MSIERHPNINAVGLVSDALQAVVRHSRGENAGAKAITPRICEITQSFAMIVSETRDMEARGWVFTPDEEDDQLRDFHETLLVFDLQRTRMAEAEQYWRECNPGNDDTLPDLGKLLGWLVEKAKGA